MSALPGKLRTRPRIGVPNGLAWSLNQPAAEMPEVSSALCLDFDGVICDSCEEGTIAAWRHAKQLWPEVFQGNDWQPFLAPMRLLRPVVHTGYEQTLLIRLVAEGAPAPDMIMADWPAVRAASMERLGLERDALIEGFGAVRDAWIARDLKGWIGHHSFYAPVADFLRAQKDPIFVITTKQARFCALLLQAAGIEIAPERLCGLEAGAKADVLLRLLTGEELAAARVRFVEDNPETLEKLAADLRLTRLGLYLADWGYNTAAMRQSAAANPRISVISQRDLESLGCAQ